MDALELYTNRMFAHHACTYAIHFASTKYAIFSSFTNPPYALSRLCKKPISCVIKPGINACNICFVSSLLVEFRRRLWFEFTAFVALFISSSVYHIVDSGLCQIPYVNYHTLQTMDFCFGDYYAIVLILHCTDLIPTHYLTIPRMFSLYVIFFITLLGELGSASELWAIDEAVIGLVLIVFIVPNIVKWVLCGLPKYKWRHLSFGMLLVFAGAFSGVYLEQWNYWFFHSIWHICMMLASYFIIVFRDKDESAYVPSYPYHILVDANDILV